ncbi:hypothetical protein VTK26DRAFT_4106 [Humicola hyalothermophila]
MGWWAMRGAFYENVTKGWVEGVRKRMPGLLAGILEDYEYLWEGYYFSTSPQDGGVYVDDELGHSVRQSWWVDEHDGWLATRENAGVASCFLPRGLFHG